MEITISNYMQFYDKIATGSRPKAEQLQELKDAGFEVVLNIMPLTAKNPLPDEETLVISLNMEYFHLPLDFTNVRPILYESFRDAMKRFSGKKIFVHCGGNIYSSSLVHMFLVIEERTDENVSLKKLLAIHTPNEVWKNFFKEFGLTNSFL